MGAILRMSIVNSPLTDEVSLKKGNQMTPVQIIKALFDKDKGYLFVDDNEIYIHGRCYSDEEEAMIAKEIERILNLETQGRA